MCQACYEEYGSPNIDNENVRKAIEAINEVYSYSCVGGNLHVMLDDMNLEGDFKFELDWLMKKEVEERTPTEQLIAEWKCLGIMKRLSLDERVSAVWNRNNSNF